MTEAGWRSLGTWRIYEDRRVLEPGEPAEEPKLLELPVGGFAALMLEFTVHSRSGRAWRATTIVPLGEVDDTTGEEVSR